MWGRGFNNIRSRSGNHQSNACKVSQNNHLRREAGKPQTDITCLLDTEICTISREGLPQAQSKGLHDAVCSRYVLHKALQIWSCPVNNIFLPNSNSISDMPLTVPGIMERKFQGNLMQGLYFNSAKITYGSGKPWKSVTLPLKSSEQLWAAVPMHDGWEWGTQGKEEETAYIWSPDVKTAHIWGECGMRWEFLKCFQLACRVYWFKFSIKHTNMLMHVHRHVCCW